MWLSGSIRVVFTTFRANQPSGTLFKNRPKVVAILVEQVSVMQNACPSLEISAGRLECILSQETLLFICQTDFTGTSSIKAVYTQEEDKPDHNNKAGKECLVTCGSKSGFLKDRNSEGCPELLNAFPSAWNLSRGLSTLSPRALPMSQ